ncbi:PKD-like family lipoprotein [Pedobacter punctiformis]|uniref:PKD-like family lipoprotein n=1 Tax=Pedobacter punctiformis TaxID=3004097 RepID=A0ABT4L5J1_9SPHI|nr:PKD-like family lipoprotein [Pedobacter sp. HCMS5-2]MCZ4243181.1 PKD-like family lipoprotein [Pedobacter sp. HCMS5-2]
MKKIYLITVLIALVFAACKKDLGNYDYKELNAASDFGTAFDNISALYGKRLIIKPVVSFTKDKGNDTTKYKYNWSYIGFTSSGSSQEIYSLANTKDLDITMSLVAGNYTFFYTITDKESGVNYRKIFTVKVTNEINEGWMLMCDVKGVARLDMLYKDNNGTFRLANDLLGQTGSGLVLSGKPVMIYMYSTGVLAGPDKLNYGMYIGTNQTTEKIEPNTFKWTPTMGLKYEMYGAIPAGFYADQIKTRYGNTAYMLGKSAAYVYDRPVNTYYSAPINYIDAEKKEFAIAPFIATSETTTTPGIFYDTDNRRFVKHVGSASSCTVIPDPSGALKLFSFSTGKDLLYMDWVKYNGGEVFSILKDPATGKRYLARFNNSNNIQSYYSEILGTDFDKAEHYAISPDLGYLFYTVGGKVYEYDMFLKTSKLMLDKGNQKISLLKFNVFKAEIKYPDGNKLIVCSYDTTLPEGENGKMEIFTVPTINADLVPLSTFSGFGKVQSLAYRER